MVVIANGLPRGFRLRGIGGRGAGKWDVQCTKYNVPVYANPSPLKLRRGFQGFAEAGYVLFEVRRAKRALIPQIVDHCRPITLRWWSANPHGCGEGDGKIGKVCLRWA